MHSQATTKLGAHLHWEDRNSLYELLHSNTKLYPRRFAHLNASAPLLIADHAYLTTRGFRQYGEHDAVALPPARQSSAHLQEVMAGRRSSRDVARPFSFELLASILEQALGCTAVVEGQQGGHALRAWPSAGGLYPLDCYVLTQKVSDLPAGLYHFNPVRSMLESLNCRPIAEVLRDGFLDDVGHEAAAALVFVATFPRTCSKYGERGYRLVLLDAGHAAQNVLLAAEQFQLKATAVGGFCDDSLANDLGIDGVTEAVVHTVVLGGAL